MANAPDPTPPGATPGQRPAPPVVPDTARTPNVDRDADKPDRLAEQERQQREHEQTHRDGPQTRQGG